MITYIIIGSLTMQFLFRAIFSQGWVAHCVFVPWSILLWNHVFFTKLDGTEFFYNHQEPGKDWQSNKQVKTFLCRNVPKTDGSGSAIIRGSVDDVKCDVLGYCKLQHFEFNGHLLFEDFIATQADNCKKDFLAFVNPRNPRK